MLDGGGLGDDVDIRLTICSIRSIRSSNVTRSSSKVDDKFVTVVRS